MQQWGLRVKVRVRKRFKINFVDYGIANRFPNKLIEVHNKLAQLEYGPLYDEIIAHEKSHSDSTYSFHDLRLDTLGFKNRMLYWKFILTTPSAWLQFSPIYKSQTTKKFYFDPSVAILWVLILFVIGLMILVRYTS